MDAMDTDVINFSLSIIFGCIGIGFTYYGRKGNFYFLLAGLALLALTPFRIGTITLAFAGLLFVLGPFFLSRM